MKQSFINLFVVFAFTAFVFNASAQHHEISNNGTTTSAVNKTSQFNFDKSIRDIVFYEDFSDGGYYNWTPMGDGQGNWEESTSNKAGGVSPECLLWYHPIFAGTSRLVSPVINTNGFSILNVSFLHKIQSYVGGFSVGIETTSDGGLTWNPVWELFWPSSENYVAFEVIGINTPDVGSENFQLCFIFEGNTDLIDQWILDNITISDPINYDVAPSLFLGLDDFVFEGDDAYISAIINNYGAETVSFDVVLEISDGTDVVFESIKPVTDIVFGDTITVDFDVWTVGLEGTDYYATVTTLLPDDENPDNNQIEKPFVIFPQDHYCIPSGYCVSGDGITDFVWAGIENYENGCNTTGYSVFTSMVATAEIGYTYPVTISTSYDDQTVSIWIDTNHDLEFSESERVITDYILDAAGILYTMDIIIPGNAMPGTTVMRVGAKRGPNSSLDPCATFNYGEWEDYSVNITGDNINYNAGLVSVDIDPLMPSGSITPYATIKNFGVQTISFPVTMTVEGTSYSSTVNVVDLAINEEIQLEFDTWDAPTGEYSVEVCTELPDDQIPYNDCLSADISTVKFDVGIDAINIGYTILMGDFIPKATIKNYGFETVTFPVTMTINDETYSSTVEVSNLASGQEKVIEFDIWSNSLGQYSVEVCTELSSDENPENNCKDMLVTVSDDARQKLVFELFTGVWCGYCPEAAEGLYQLQQEFPNTTAVIAWHINDDFEIFSGGLRRTYYDIAGFPTVWFDGVSKVVGGGIPMYPAYLPVYQERIEVPSNFNIEMEIIRTDTAVYNVNATVEVLEGVNEENLSLFVVLTESDIEFPGVENLDFVARDVYPSDTGIVVDLSTQTTQTFNNVITLDDEYVLANCEVIVYIQNIDTKEVYQGTSMKLTEATFGVDEVDMLAQVQVYPNPASNAVNIKSENEIRNISVYNNKGQIVYDRAVRAKHYRMNTSGFDTGIFYFRIETTSGVITSKVNIIK